MNLLFTTVHDAEEIRVVYIEKVSGVLLNYNLVNFAGLLKRIIREGSKTKCAEKKTLVYLLWKFEA